jgi:integrase
VPWTDFRDLALVSLLLGAGLKVSHVERLTINCIDMHEERIDLSLPLYTHRARIMAFAMAPLRAWLLIQAKRHGGEVSGTHPVFEGDRSVGFGRTAKSLFMHASSIHRRTQRCLEAAGVTGDRACAQTLRNTYAGLLIDAGASDEELVDFMGLKASITSTRLRQAYAQSKARHKAVISTPAAAHPDLKADQPVSEKGSMGG